MISIIISTISHFWFVTLTNFWQSALVSLFSMLYTPPFPQMFFCGGQFFFHAVQLGAGKISNFWGASVLGGVLISILGKGAQTVFFRKVINDQLCKLKNMLMAKLSASCVHANFSHFYLEFTLLKIFCPFECSLKLSKKCLLVFGNNSVKV